MPNQPLPRHRPPYRTLYPGDGFSRRRSQPQQFASADAVQLPASLVEAAVPVEKCANLLGNGGVFGDGLQRNAVFVHRLACTPCRARSPAGLESSLTEAARVDDFPPQLAFV